MHDPAQLCDQNFLLDGKPYDYRAAERYRILTELEQGLLTRYPLEPIEIEKDDASTITGDDKSRRFHVALSLPDEHRACVEEIADTICDRLKLIQAASS